VVSIYARTLQRAAERLGGRWALARYLRVPRADLEAWLRGQPPPRAIFLNAVDLVLDDLDERDAVRAQRARAAASLLERRESAA
jgi:hypothetical protein